MSLRVDRVQLEIVINNDQARKQLRDLDEEARKLTKEMKGLDKSSQEYAQKAARLQAVRQQMDNVYQSIGITNMTMKELTTRQKELNAILLHLRPGTEEYKKLKEEAKAVSDRIGELRGKAKETGVSIKGMADGFNRYFGIITAGIASITGVVMGFRKISEQVAHLDDVYSDVMKTTGMTRDAVVDLNKEFQKMDTRTAREQLNLLARDAGKLGLSSKKDILDFVEAGNQINVALGEDLGADAIKQIGKMVNVYEQATAQLQGSGLKEQMLAVGSAVNELGASSTASEPYLVQFAGRLGGISKQARISIADILGYASALDQEMQQVEMSSTAFQKFIMKLMADPAKFARLAGLEVKGFTELLRTDANSAIKEVLAALNSRGGFQELIPIFEEIGLDGSRAVGVLSSMAASINKIDDAQRISNQAMTEGVSITKEYEIKNNNLQAALEKARKSFLEKSLALGEKLTPAMIKSTNAFTYLVKLLTVLPDFIRRNQILLISLAGAFLALNAAKLKVIAATILEHLTMQRGITLRIKEEVQLRALMIQEQYRLALINKTTIAQKAAAIATATWRAALIALGGPLGLAIMAITGAIAAIKLYDKHNAEAVRIEELRIRRINEIAAANQALATSTNAVGNLMKNLNNYSWEQIAALDALTKKTLKQAQANLVAAKAKQLASQHDAERLTVWDKVKVFFSSMFTGDAEGKMQDIVTKRGKEAAEQFNEQITELQNNIETLSGQHEQLSNILTAEAQADAIVAENVAQLTEKNRLLGVALQHVKKDSEDYNRIQAKIEKVTAEINKRNKETLDDSGKLITAYKKLAEQIAKYKETVQDLVTKGDKSQAKEMGKVQKGLEAQLFVIDKIVASGGDYNKFLEELTDDSAALAEELEGIDEINKKLFETPWFKKSIELYNIGKKYETDEDSEARSRKIQAGLDKEANKDFFGLDKNAFSTAWIVDQVETTSNAAFDIWRNKIDERFDYEMNALQRQMDRELSNKNLTEEQKDKIRERYAAKERKLKTEAFKKQKTADLAQAGINGALAITKTFAQYGFTPAAWAAAAGQAIATAAQMSVIASTPVPQFAKGRYPVIGADDGKLYNATYTGKPETRIYSTPSLVAEQGSELIVDAPTTRNLMMNYPGIIEAIYAARVPQRAAGNLDTTAPAPVFDRETIVAIKEFTQQLKQPIRGKWVLYDLEKSQEKLSSIRTESTF